jgi:hypothetical protein
MLTRIFHGGELKGGDAAELREGGPWSKSGAEVPGGF